MDNLYPCIGFLNRKKMLKESKNIFVSSKGRITIPADIRAKLNIKRGTRLYIQERGLELVVTPITPEYIESLAGILAGYDMAKGLLEDRARDREKEDTDCQLEGR